MICVYFFLGFFYIGKYDCRNLLYIIEFFPLLMQMNRIFRCNDATRSSKFLYNLTVNSSNIKNTG